MIYLWIKVGFWGPGKQNKEWQNSIDRYLYFCHFVPSHVTFSSNEALIQELLITHVTTNEPAAGNLNIALEHEIQ